MAKRLISLTRGSRPLTGSTAATPAAPPGTRMTPANTVPVVADPRAGQLPPGFGTPRGVPQPQPFDATYENQIGLNQRNFTRLGINLDEEQGGIQRSYGLDNTQDPFSRMALLRQAYENRARGAGNALAARGQLYSGAYQNAQNQAALGFEQDTHGLREQYTDALASIARRRASGLTDFEQGNINAGAAALDRAAQIRPDVATLGIDRTVKPGPKAPKTVPIVADERDTGRLPRETKKPKRPRIRLNTYGPR